MIKIRLDVDYPYVSRQKSFAAVALSIKKPHSGYLKNAKIIAHMVNESPLDVHAYWFFTPYTVPDEELLSLLNPERHDVCLHVATKPYPELERLEKATGRKVEYYTVHGTARLLGRIIWHRKLNQAKAPIPDGFPLKSFYDYPTVHLDRACYDHSPERALEIAREAIAEGEVLHVHPEWLNQTGTLNHRAAYYGILKTVLQVDTELEVLAVRKKVFFKAARYPEHYDFIHDRTPSPQFIAKLKARGIDIYSFIEHTWCCPAADPPAAWLKAPDNIAILKVPPYADWLASVGKKTRNMIRKAEKSGVQSRQAEATEELAEGIWKIYRETPVRQGRGFAHYGWSLDKTKLLVSSTAKESTFIGSYLDGELVGFIQLVHGDDITVLTQILSMQKHWDKALNNALVAKAVEVCADKQVPWLMYGRMGNHPTLDSFKVSNGFSKFGLARYYIPLSTKGRIAIKVGLHRVLKDALPQWLKGLLIPVFNWASRIKVKVKNRRR